jgi:hypothetical protein
VRISVAVTSSPTTHLWRSKGEWKYSSYSFTTSALDVVSGQRQDPAAIYPRGKDPRNPLQEAVWVPETVWDRTSISRSSSPYPDTILTELPRSVAVTPYMDGTRLRPRWDHRLSWTCVCVFSVALKFSCCDSRKRQKNYKSQYSNLSWLSSPPYSTRLNFCIYKQSR